MAIKSTIYKAQLQIADMDRQLYADHALTLALHPSEAEERLLVRLLAFVLNVPHDTDRGALQFARGLSDADEPDLWQHDLTGQLVQWIEVGQPDDRRLAKACACDAGICQTVSFVSRVSLFWMPPHQMAAALPKTYSVTRSARAQALDRRRSSGWPTSIQCNSWPVKSCCHRSGSSLSDRPRANTKAP